MTKRKVRTEYSLKSADDINRIREAGKIIAEIFIKLKALDFNGMTTADIDAFVEKEILAAKARPSFATVPGYSHATCISVNDGVVHGIPSKKVICKSGDIIKIDVGTVKNGYFGDACRTYGVGVLAPEVKKFVDHAEKALEVGINAAQPGNKLGDVGYAIQTYVESHGYSVVRDYTGHGVGFAVHEDPVVLHYGHPGTGLTLRPGMVICVEPMINMGRCETKVLSDGWTAITRDGSLSAQFEHTIAITETGNEILTR
jgi:methionyl aminopeptidase